MKKIPSRITRIEDYQLVDPKDVVIDYVTIFQSWEKIDGIVYWKWRCKGEEDWHYKETAYKESPIIEYKKMTPEEYEMFVKCNKEAS